MIINYTYPSALRGAALIHREVVTEDCYGLRRFDDLANIFDIGANVGWFSVYARMNFPHANVYAFEPSTDTHYLLQQNTAYLNIAVDWCALGDGQPVHVLQGNMDGCNQTRQGGRVPSKTLRQLVQPCGSPYFVKLDCEGGERHVLPDVDVLANAAGWAMEYHSDLVGMSVEDYCAKLPPHTCTATGPLRWLILSR